MRCAAAAAVNREIYGRQQTAMVNNRCPAYEVMYLGYLRMSSPKCQCPHERAYASSHFLYPQRGACSHFSSAERTLENANSIHRSWRIHSRVTKREPKPLSVNVIPPKPPAPPSNIHDQGRRLCRSKTPAGRPKRKVHCLQQDSQSTRFADCDRPYTSVAEPPCSQSSLATRPRSQECGSGVFQKSQ